MGKAEKYFKKNLILFLLTVIFILAAPLLFADAKITNLTMVPANPNFGDSVTLDFDYCSSNSSGNLVIAVSTFPGLHPAQTVGQVFVVSSAGLNVPTVDPPVGGQGIGYTIAQPVGPACTDCGNNAGTSKHYTMSVNIPNANMFPGCGNTSLHLFVGERDYYLGGSDWAGLNGCTLNSLAWTIGTPVKQFSIHKRSEGVVTALDDLILYSIDFSYGNGQLTISDPLPSGNVIEIVSVGPTLLAGGVGPGAQAGTITWTLPDKTGQPGISSGTVWFLAKLKIATAGLNITNTATGSMAGILDQSSSVTNSVGQVTMSVKKSFDPPGGFVNTGDMVTYYLDYQVNGSKLGAYESFDEMPLGSSYTGASNPPGWKFLPYAANTGQWNVMNPCGTGDNYIQANPLGPNQYPGLLLNSANPHFCTGEIVVDTEIEGTYAGADSQILIRNNGLTGGSSYSIGLILSQDSGPAYMGFQTITAGGGPAYPGTPWPSQLVQLNKWYRVHIKVSQVGNDYLYQAKAWPRGDPEPSAWMATWTQTGGATDPNWRCDGMGNYTDWRPGFNEQGGDGTVYDSFDNFVIYNPFTASNAVLYDTIPAGMSYLSSNGATAPVTTGPIVEWDLGASISDQSGSYTWWGPVTGSCMDILNTAAMNGSSIPVFSNEVSINVSCGSPTFTPTYTASPTASNSPTASPTFTASPTITPTSTPVPAIINILFVPLDPATLPGGYAQFSVTMQNSGSAASNVVLYETLPAEVTFEEDPSDTGANTGWASAANIISRPLTAAQMTSLNSGTAITFLFTVKTSAGLAQGTKIQFDPVTAGYDDMIYTGAQVISNPAFITVGNIVIYPNPFDPAKAVDNKMKFANLPRDTQIAIFSLSGEQVRTFNPEGTSVAKWDGKNASGNMVSPGIYYYIIKYNDGKSRLTGKIFVVKQ